jgi:hypothetical protein
VQSEEFSWGERGDIAGQSDEMWDVGATRPSPVAAFGPNQPLQAPAKDGPRLSGKTLCTEVRGYVRNSVIVITDSGPSHHRDHRVSGIVIKAISGAW